MDLITYFMMDIYTRSVLFVTFQKSVQSYYLSFGKNRFLQVTSESIHLLKFELTNGRTPFITIYPFTGLSVMQASCSVFGDSSSESNG